MKFLAVFQDLEVSTYLTLQTSMRICNQCILLLGLLYGNLKMGLLFYCKFGLQKGASSIAEETMGDAALPVNCCQHYWGKFLKFMGDKSKLLSGWHQTCAFLSLGFFIHKIRVTKPFSKYCSMRLKEKADAEADFEIKVLRNSSPYNPGKKSKVCKYTHHLYFPFKNSFWIFDIST